MSLIVVEYQRAKQKLRNSLDFWKEKRNRATAVFEGFSNQDRMHSFPPKGEISLPHQVPLASLETTLRTNLRRGMLSFDAAELLLSTGKNTVPRIAVTPLALRVLTPLSSQFCPVLWIALVIFFIEFIVFNKAFSLQLCGILLVIIVIIAVPDWLQQASVIRHLRALEAAVMPTGHAVTVVRDGVEQCIASADLVVGDVVRLVAPQPIPADMRVLEVKGLLVNSSSLTGEAHHVAPSVESSDTNPLVSTNMLYAGSVAVEGEGYAVVMAVGHRTQMAQIIASCAIPLRHMQEELQFFVRAFMAGALFSACVVICAAAVLRLETNMYDARYSVWEDVLDDASCIIIAFIPVGLPIALSGTFWMLKRMLARRGHVLVGSSTTVETLGRVSAVCTDKTGTLTFNALSAIEALIGCTAYAVPEPPEYGTDTRGNISLPIIDNADPHALRNFLTACVLSSHRNETAVDMALMNIAASFTTTVTKLDILAEYSLCTNLEFTPVRKYSMSHFTHNATKSPRLVLKGACEIVLPQCTTYQGAGGRDMPLLRDDLDAITAWHKTKGEEGDRIIAVAETSHPEALDGFTLLAAVCLRDPIRPKVSTAIRTLRQSGIQIIVISGDHAATCVAVARKVGIVTDPHVHDSEYIVMCNEGDYPGPEWKPERSMNSDETSARSMDHTSAALVLQGSSISSLTPQQWRSVLSHPQLIFARTTPEQKLLVVERLRAMGHVVAVLGDGLNDAPALKLADVGISMKDGSSVAHDAADIIVDSFPGVVKCILVGRIATDNLRKVIVYMIPAGAVASFFPAIFHIVLGLPQNLAPFFMLVICCGTDLFSCMVVLSHAPEEDDVMTEPPRRAKRDRLVTNRMLGIALLFGFYEACAGYGMFLIVLSSSGVGWHEMYGFRGEGSIPENTLKEAASAYFVALVCCQFAVLMVVSVRSKPFLSFYFDNTVPAYIRIRQGVRLVVGITGSLLIALFFSAVHSIRQEVSHMASLKVWGLSLLAAAVLFGAAETLKYIRMRRGKLNLF